MTNALNALVERFTAAEHAYQQDLEGAVAYERDRSDFLAALSHELRTPLNAILGFTDVLLTEVDGPLTDDARENLEIVRQSGAHLRRLINDVLDLSAIESGHIQLERQHTDVLSTARDVVREAKVTLQKDLKLRLTGEPTLAWADPVRLRQIIGNLVSNAVKFTSQGEVHVHVERVGDEVCLSVADTGPGIAPSHQARIFEIYQQVGDLKSQSFGAGLGLAITRRLVAIQGGRIALESELGQGTTFRVTLPGNPPQDSIAPPPSSVRASERPPSPDPKGSEA
jgi:signal transduction histidine kinase